VSDHFDDRFPTASSCGTLDYSNFDNWVTMISQMVESGWGVTEEKIKCIFYQVEIINSYTGILLAELERRIDNWSPQSTLGDIFIKMVS